VSAEEYNRIRRILFSTVHNPSKGFSCAYDYLEGYRARIGRNGYVGIKAELRFYERHAREFKLTVAGDMGEHADFSGTYGTEPVRFDVTTNIDIKNFEDYEPYMGNGPQYKIALLNQDSFDVVDVLDLAFKRCSCGGYLIPCVVLLGENFNRHGESQWSNDQLLVETCTGCSEIVEKDRYTHHGLLSPQEYFDHSLEDHGEAIRIVEQHSVSAYKYFRREFDDKLMSVAAHDYKITEPKGGGYWSLDFTFKNQAIADGLPSLAP
jgi:hypothetical protein